MTVKSYILSSLIFLLAQFHLQSQTVEVSGRVVEVTDGVPKGVSGVTVSVTGESYDITSPDGSFTLIISESKEYVKINLENCPHPVVSPAGNKIFIPPFDPLKIQICASANKKLQAKVKKLNGQLDDLSRKRKHTQRQLARMQQTMLDTILFYESKVQSLEGELDKRDETIAEKQVEIEALQSQVAQLEQQLFAALEKKYLRQKEQFDFISAALEEYLDQAKNLKDMLRPERVGQYFTSNAGAREELYKVIENYNAARNLIVREHEQHVVGVANYWEEIELADDLEMLYDFILNEVHEEGIYPMEFSVNGNLKEYLTGNRSKSVRRSAEEGASAGYSKLAPMLEELEVQTEQLLYRLKTEM